MVKNSDLQSELIPKTSEEISHNRKIMYTCTIISTLVIVLELTGGILSNSVAILTDSINTISDITIFLIASICSTVRRPPSSKNSYGYYRVEILGFLMSVAIIWSLSI